MTGDAEVASLLVDKGAAVDATNKQGNIALLLAVWPVLVRNILCGGAYTAMAPPPQLVALATSTRLPCIPRHRIDYNRYVTRIPPLSRP